MVHGKYFWCQRTCTRGSRVSSKKSWSWKDFIKSSAVLAGSLVLLFAIIADEAKIKLAILGTGWWGTDFY